MERSAIVCYLHRHPEAMQLWNNGWEQYNRPSLAQMLESLCEGRLDLKDAKQMCASLGHLTHGSSAGADWNLVQLGEAGMGYSIGKTLNNPELCDFVCSMSLTWLVTLMSMMRGCFPVTESIEADPLVTFRKRVSPSGLPN